MEPQTPDSVMPEALMPIDTSSGLEWHAFLAFNGWRSRLVGRVEAVSREEITLTRIDLDAESAEEAEVRVAWPDVDCIAVCGPDRDEDLFDLLRDEPHS